MIIRYKYKRFHVWYNQKVDKYRHVNIIVNMRPYDSKKVHKMQREANDHLSNDLCLFAIIIISIIVGIAVYWLLN